MYTMLKWQRVTKRWCSMQWPTYIFCSSLLFHSLSTWKENNIITRSKFYSLCFYLYVLLEVGSWCSLSRLTWLNFTMMLIWFDAGSISNVYTSSCGLLHLLSSWHQLKSSSSDHQFFQKLSLSLMIMFGMIETQMTSWDISSMTTSWLPILLHSF